MSGGRPASEDEIPSHPKAKVFDSRKHTFTPERHYGLSRLPDWSRQLEHLAVQLRVFGIQEQFLARCVPADSLDEKQIDLERREPLRTSLFTEAGAHNKRDGIFINTNRRPELKEIIENLKAETGIVFNSDLVTQALTRWWKELSSKR